LDLYEQGLSIEEIAQQRNLRTSTITTHLAELIEMGKQIDIEGLVFPERQKIIMSSIEEIGDSAALKPIYEYLGEQFSYDEIRLVKALWRKKQTE
jgi:ATP-dependent DNA helicase RecQ